MRYCPVCGAFHGAATSDCPGPPTSSPTMTNLPALREAVAKMTEGPWAVLAEFKIQAHHGECIASSVSNRNAAGIVALRNTAPALLDEVEALREDNRRLYEEDRRIFAELSRTLAALSGQDDPAEAVHQLGPSEYCAELAKRRMDELEAARAENAELTEAGKSLGLEIAQLRAELGEMDVRLAGVEAERDAARVALANVQADLAAARADYYRLKRILQVAHGALADAGVPGLLIPGAFDDPLAPTIAQLCADLVVARTALDSIESLPAGGSVLVVEDGTHRFVTIDRAAWQAWQAAKGTR